MTSTPQDRRCLACDLSASALAGCVPEVRQLLIEGADPKDSSECNTALNDAVSQGFTEIVALLLEAGAQANRVDDTTEDPPLWVALYNGHSEIVELLLKSDAHPEAISLARIARQSDSPEMLSQALAAGVDLNQLEAGTKRTALHESAMYGHVQCVRALVDASADVGAHDKFGSTALSLAEQNHHTDVVAILRAHQEEG